MVGGTTHPPAAAESRGARETLFCALNVAQNHILIVTLHDVEKGKKSHDGKWENSRTLKQKTHTLSADTE